MSSGPRAASDGRSPEVGLAELVDERVGVEHAVAEAPGLPGLHKCIAGRAARGAREGQHVALESVVEGFADFAHVGIARAQVHVVTDTHRIGAEGDHVGRFAHCLAVRYLALALVKILHLKAEKIARRGEGETGACGIIAEKAYAKAAVEYFAGDVVLAQMP